MNLATRTLKSLCQGLPLFCTDSQSTQKEPQNLLAIISIREASLLACFTFAQLQSGGDVSRFLFERQLYCFDLSGLIVWQSARYSPTHGSLCWSRGGGGPSTFCAAVAGVCYSHPWENLMAGQLNAYWNVFAVFILGATKLVFQVSSVYNFDGSPPDGAAELKQGGFLKSDGTRWQLMKSKAIAVCILLYLSKVLWVDKPKYFSELPKNERIYWQKVKI